MSSTISQLKKQDSTMDGAPRSNVAHKRRSAPLRKKLSGAIKLPAAEQGSEPCQVHVTIDLGRLPLSIGCHAPNGKIELCSDDAPAVLDWIDRKLKNTGKDDYIIVNVVSWCPPWLAMQISAHLALNEKVHELRHYFQGVQHNIFDPTGVVGELCRGIDA